ncbi:MAG TPA: hypothetical protein VIY28_12855 [Pseudonocardiaceae bacterium]
MFDEDGLGLSAAAELKEQTITWQVKVVAEAARLATGREAGTQREPVTPNDIVRAVHNVDGLPAVHQQPRGAAASRAASYVAAVLAGYFGNNIDKPWGSIGFSITVISGALTGWYGEQAGRKGKR